MTISAELIAICILGVSLVSLGWKVTSDIRHELRQEIHLLGDRIGSLEQRVGSLEHRMSSLEQRMDSLEHRMGSLEQRMARVEGWIEGRLFKQPELKAKPATSS